MGLISALNDLGRLPRDVPFSIIGLEVVSRVNRVDGVSRGVVTPTKFCNIPTLTLLSATHPSIILALPALSIHTSGQNLFTCGK